MVRIFGLSKNEASPQLVDDRQLVVALVVHDLDGLINAQIGHDAQRGTQVQRGDLLVVPPVFQVKKPVKILITMTNSKLIEIKKNEQK